MSTHGSRDAQSTNEKPGEHRVAFAHEVPLFPPTKAGVRPELETRTGERFLMGAVPRAELVVRIVLVQSAARELRRQLR